LNKKTNCASFYLPDYDFLLWAKFKKIAKPTASQFLVRIVRETVEKYELKHGPIRVNHLGSEILPEEEVPAV